MTHHHSSHHGRMSRRGSSSTVLLALLCSALVAAATVSFLIFRGPSKADTEAVTREIQTLRNTELEPMASELQSLTRNDLEMARELQNLRKNDLEAMARELQQLRSEVQLLKTNRPRSSEPDEVLAQ